MDAKSLAKSKRAHSQHHKKHHPNQKAKGTTSSAGASGTDKTPGKAIKEKPHQSRVPAALPSNWDQYEDEYESNTESQTVGRSSQPSDIVLPKSKGADYAYLISEAKFQQSMSSSSEIFPSFDDFVADFDQGTGSFFSVRGESILSSIQNDSFVVEDKATASYEASFLSLDLHALAEQLAKVDLPKRLFMEADLLPPELFAEGEHQDQDKRGNISANADKNEPQTQKSPDKEKYAVNPDRTNPVEDSGVGSKPSDFKAEMAEAELDLLLDSFADAKLGLKETTSTSPSPVKDTSSRAVHGTVAVDIDDTLDDLLKETSEPAPEVNTAPPPPPPPHSVSRSKLLDDFDSWLDTI